jgi:hypothetical protein
VLHQLFQYEKEKFAELGGVKNVIFIDDTFNIPFPRFKDICRLSPSANKSSMQQEYLQAMVRCARESTFTT